MSTCSYVSFEIASYQEKTASDSDVSFPRFINNETSGDLKISFSIISPLWAPDFKCYIISIIAMFLSSDISFHFSSTGSSQMRIAMNHFLVIRNLEISRELSNPGFMLLSKEDESWTILIIILWRNEERIYSNTCL